MRFYVSGIEKTVYRKAIDAEDADEAVAKFKEMIEKSIIEDEGTYLDEIMCRTEGQEFPEIYDGAEDNEDEEYYEDDDNEEDSEVEYEEIENEIEIQQTPNSENNQSAKSFQPSSFNQNQY